MKRNEDMSKKIMAIFVFVLFVGSSIGIALSYAPDRTNNELPEKVTHGSLSNDIRNLMISNGFMIINYECSDDCASDVETISKFIEDKPDAYLVVTKNSDSKELEFETQQGTEEITNVENQNLLNAYCSVTYYNYDACLIKQL